MPQYEHFTRGGSACVGNGLATGVVVKPDGPHSVKLGWEIPNLPVKLLLMLSIVFTGILPGLLLFGLVWMVISSDVERLKQEIAHALTSGQPMQPGSPMAMAMASRPSKPGGVALVFGILLVLGSLGLFAFSYDNFEGASRADRYAAEASSSYRSNYGLSAEFWYSRARRRREEGTMAAAAGVVGLIIAVGLFLARGSKVRAWEAQTASNGPMMSMPPQQPQYGMMPQQQQYGMPPQQQYGMPPQQQQYPQQPPQGYGPPQQPMSGPNPYGANPQGGWPPGGGNPQG